MDQHFKVGRQIQTGTKKTGTLENSIFHNILLKTVCHFKFLSVFVVRKTLRSGLTYLRTKYVLQYLTSKDRNVSQPSWDHMFYNLSLLCVTLVHHISICPDNTTKGCVRSWLFFT